MSTLNVPFRTESSVDVFSAYDQAVEKITKNGGYTYDGLTSAEAELKACGIDLNQPGKIEQLTAKASKMVKTASGTLVSLSAPNDSSIGIDTFAISNELIQDFNPATNINESPLNSMLPYKSSASVQLQQDNMQAFWGYAGSGTAVGGTQPIVELLQVTSNSFKGYPISETSYLQGNDLIALREAGSSDTAKRGAQQRLNYGMLNLINRASTGLEMNRIESAVKGTWTWNSDGQDYVISSGIPGSNVGVLSGSLGTYSLSTNRLVNNPAYTGNPLQELGKYITYVRNMGMDIEKIVVDNVTYSAIFNCTAVTDKVVYISNNSNNNVMDIRRNLFQITTIPMLQGVNIEVDNRAWKTDTNPTSTLNTRPLWWGKTVTSSSFRALVVVKQNGISRIGNFGFFPNVYARQGLATPVGGTDGGIVALQQDLAQYNFLEQKIQIAVFSNSAPMYYLPNGVFVFDFGVTVEA